MSKTPTGCGITDHDDDCLCDVHVHATTPASFDPFTHWGVQVAERAGHAWDEGPEKLLNLLEALAKAKDAMENMKTFDHVDLRGVARASVELRNKVIDWLNRGESIIDAPREFQESWGNVLVSLTKGAPSELWAWDEARWAEFEDWAMERPTVRYRAIMSTFNVGRGSAVALERLYGSQDRVSTLHQFGKARDYIVAHPSQKSQFLRDKIAELFGIELSVEDLTRIRHVLRRQNRVPLAGETLGEFRDRVTAV